MRKGQPERGPVHQGDDPQARLQQHQSHKAEGQCRAAARQAFSAGGEPGDRGGGGHQEVGADAVVELHRRLAVQQGVEPTSPAQVVLGEEPPVHQGPVVVDEAGVVARHQTAQHDLDEHPARQDGRRQAPSALEIGAPRTEPGFEPGPDQQAEDQERQAEVDGQPLGRHRDPSLKAARHHPPARQALQTAQRKEQPGPPDQPPGNPA